MFCLAVSRLSVVLLMGFPSGHLNMWDTIGNIEVASDVHVCVRLYTLVLFCFCFLLQVYISPGQLFIACTCCRFSSGAHESVDADFPSNVSFSPWCLFLVLSSVFIGVIVCVGLSLSVLLSVFTGVIMCVSLSLSVLSSVFTGVIMCVVLSLSVLSSVLACVYWCYRVCRFFVIGVIKCVYWCYSVCQFVVIGVIKCVHWCYNVCRFVIIGVIKCVSLCLLVL